MSQLDLFKPKRDLFSVTTDPLVDFALKANHAVAIGVSGGKDSSCAASATFKHLDAIGHTGPRLLIHSDLGRIEWGDSLPTCEQLASRLNVDLVTVRRPAGGMVERWMSRWDANIERYIDLSCVKLILPWSTPSMRFCTSELKTAIICRDLVRRFPKQKIISVTGIRRQESANRAKRSVAKVQEALQSDKYATWGVDWNSIIDWTLDEVWACHEAFDLPIHEAYKVYGSSRVSCCFCIMSTLEDLVKSSLCCGNEDVYRELCQLEVTSTFSFQDKVWLSDVAPHLLSGEQRALLHWAKRTAKLRESAEQRIPDHLLYEEGWPNVLPTYSEAVMLSEVRTEVSHLMDIPVHFTTPDDILNRYEGLMRLKAQKEAFKAEVIIRKERKAIAKNIKQKLAHVPV